jgi:hypothetical protein
MNARILTIYFRFKSADRPENAGEWPGTGGAGLALKRVQIELSEQGIQQFPSGGR